MDEHDGSTTKSNEFEVVLSREEIQAILLVLQRPDIPGLGQPPLPNITPEQAAYGLITAERALRARGLAHISGDVGEEKKLLVHEDVLEVVALCSLPSQSLFVTKIASDAGRRAQFITHHGRGKWVIHTTPQAGLHRLRTMVAWSAVRDDLDLFTPLTTETSAVADVSFDLSPDHIRAARDMAASGETEQGINLLMAQGVAQDAAHAFIQALATPHQIYVYQQVQPVNKTSVSLQSFTVLSLANQLWLMYDKPIAEGETAVSYVGTTTVSEIQGKLAEVMKD